MQAKGLSAVAVCFKIKKRKHKDIKTEIHKIFVLFLNFCLFVNLLSNVSLLTLDLLKLMLAKLK